MLIILSGIAFAAIAVQSFAWLCGGGLRISQPSCRRVEIWSGRGSFYGPRPRHPCHGEPFRCVGAEEVLYQYLLIQLQHLMGCMCIFEAMFEQLASQTV